MQFIQYNNEALSYLSPIPTDYQLVEYIESTGTQRIDTTYTPNVNTEIKTTLNWGTQSTEWAVFLWVTGNDRSSDWILLRIYSSTSTNLNPWFCNTTYGECQITVSTGVDNAIELKKNSCKVNGTNHTITTNSTPYASPIVLFGGNNGGSKGWRCGKVKMKETVFSESGVEKRHFYPCYRKSDNVIGMYDTVTSTFFVNSGSGTFTKGPNA